MMESPSAVDTATPSLTEASVPSSVTQVSHPSEDNGNTPYYEAPEPNYAGVSSPVIDPNHLSSPPHSSSPSQSVTAPAHTSPAPVAQAQPGTQALYQHPVQHLHATSPIPSFLLPAGVAYATIDSAALQSGDYLNYPAQIQQQFSLQNPHLQTVHIPQAGQQILLQNAQTSLQNAQLQHQQQQFQQQFQQQLQQQQQQYQQQQAHQQQSQHHPPPPTLMNTVYQNNINPSNIYMTPISNASILASGILGPAPGAGPLSPNIVPDNVEDNSDLSDNTLDGNTNDDTAVEPINAFTPIGAGQQYMNIVSTMPLGTAAQPLMTVNNVVTGGAPVTIQPSQSSQGQPTGPVQVTQTVNAGVAGPATANEDIEMRHRFKVVKLVSSQPYTRGRWTCFDYHDDHQNTINIGKDVPTNKMIPNGHDDPESFIVNDSNGSNSGAGTANGSDSNEVAIDNKIEQAMDLVKSHLMFAVREEVDVLRERIKELEADIAKLKPFAPPNILAQLTSNRSTAANTTPAVAGSVPQPAEPASGVSALTTRTKPSQNHSIPDAGGSASAPASPPKLTPIHQADSTITTAQTNIAPSSSFVNTSGSPTNGENNGTSQSATTSAAQASITTTTPTNVISEQGTVLLSTVINPSTINNNNTNGHNNGHNNNGAQNSNNSLQQT